MNCHSSDKKNRGTGFQSFTADDDDDDGSDKESLVVDENPTKAKKSKDTKAPKLKLKLSCKLCNNV